MVSAEEEMDKQLDALAEVLPRRTVKLITDLVFACIKAERENREK